MAYTDRNFKTKKALKDALAKGDKIGVYEPGVGICPRDGRVMVEGPHYVAHTWYGTVTLKEGYIVSVK